MKAERIVIIGAGMVGFSLAEQLLNEGHDIAMVEHNEATCREINEKLDVLVVQGSGANPRILQQAGISDADILLAVSPEDKVNILACDIAQQYGVKERIARIRSLDYINDSPGFSLKRLGVNRLIDPEKAVVDSIYQFIQTPGAIEAASFEDGNILLREFEVTANMPIINKNLMQIREMAHNSRILIMTIVRDDHAIIPSGDVVIQEKDEILALFPKESKDEFLRMLAMKPASVKKVIVSGDNLTSFKMAQHLDRTINKVIWVCQDYEYGKWGASHLDSVEVLHGDTTDMDILKEIHIERADFFLGTSKNTEYNILSALLAKSHGAREIVAISDQPPKSNRMFKSIGIDHVINPRITTAATIMDLVHRGRIVSELKIHNLDLEAIRIKAGKNCRMIGVPLKKAWKSLAKKAIIGAVIRDQKLIIPTGDCALQAKDQAFVITRAKTLKQVKNLFKERL